MILVMVFVGFMKSSIAVNTGLQDVHGADLLFTKLREVSLAVIKSTNFISVTHFSGVEFIFREGMDRICSRVHKSFL